MPRVPVVRSVASGLALLPLLLLGGRDSFGSSAGRDVSAVRIASPPTSFVGDAAPAPAGVSARWQSLSRRVGEGVSGLAARQDIGTVGVYLFDLAGGGTVAINEKKRYVAASLVKVPLLIACLRQAQAQPGYLEKTIIYRGLEDPASASYSFPPKLLVEAGRKYTVRELIERVAVYSDNGAYFLLRKSLDPKHLEAVLRATGNADLVDEAGDAGISPEGLGRMFRLLYDETLLGGGRSDWLLRLLSKAYFREGLVAGLPGSYAVAHKYGEFRIVQRGRTVVQLHDGGIVYHPGHPYVLCVFTSGWDIRAQAAVIAEIARLVDGEISSL